MTPFSLRLHRALDLSHYIHEGQFRKDPDLRIPYASHPAAVGQMLMNYGCREDVVIAGYFHDVKEDQPGMLSLIEPFGSYVMSLVDWVSERKFDEFGRPVPWLERKMEQAQRMRTAPLDAKMICACDKIHNMQSLIVSCERGPQIWQALKATPEEQVIRMKHLEECLRDGWLEEEGPASLLQEMTATLWEIERIVHPHNGCDEQ